VLLVKDDVGRAKPSTRRLPHEQFTFGKPESKNCESAAQVTQKWQLHEKSNRINSPDPRDFKKLNKMSLRDGAVTAKVSKRDKPLEFLRFDPKNQAHMHWIRFV